MHDPEEYVPRLVVLRLEILFEDVYERFISGLITLYDLSRLFIDDEEMVVFVEYVHLVIG